MFYVLKLSLLTGILLLAFQSSALGSASVANLASLGGASPSEVSSFFGGVAVAPAPATDEMPCSEGTYTFSGGTATVQFCRDKAFSLLLSFNEGSATPEALLARTALSLTSPALAGLVLAEEGPGYRTWTRNPDAEVPGGVVPAERLMLSQGPEGWSQLHLDFPAAQ